MIHLVSTLMRGGRAVALTALMATATLAQSPASDAPAGMTTMEAVDFPTLSTVGTDEAVAEDLVAQGYEKIVILRAEDVLVVTAERGGVPTEMVFSPDDGTLLMIDGVEPMTGDPASTDFGG